MTTTATRGKRRPRLIRVRVALFALFGASIALALAGSVGAAVGPFDTTVSVRPGLAGHTAVRLAPLGSIEIDTHDAPVSLELRVDELRLEEAEEIARDPQLLRTLEDDVAGDVRSALQLVAVRSLAVAILGGAVGALAASARLRPVVAGAALGGVLGLSIGGLTALTFDADAVAEPRYSGLLTVAPTAVGDVRGIVDRFGEYRAQLTELVANVVSLYRTAQGLPTFDPGNRAVRVLHVSDIHLNPQAFDLIELLVDQFDIDVVADTGDVTDWGTEPESSLVERIGRVGAPYVWVRGNHDSRATQQAIAEQPNAVVLDGDSVTLAGLRFWGVGDPRYTPDKSQATGKDVEREQAEELAPALARLLRADEPPEVDVAMVHDARTAAELDDQVPLVLAGHTHRPRRARIGSATLLVEGSTGGGGLRALEGDEPEPLTCSILYFDPTTRRLVAYDRVTVRGLGESGAEIERRVVAGARS